MQITDKKSEEAKGDMKEKSLKHRLMIIISYMFVLPSFVLCYIFYKQNATLSPTHFILFFLIIALAIVGIILVRYVVSTELNEISSCLNLMTERFEKTTESLNQTKEELRESEEKYRNILESIEEGYYEVDIKGNFTFFNESMPKILGYEREELMGMNNRQYADEENSRKVYQIYNQVYQTGDPVKNFEWQIIRKDGAHRDVEVSIVLVRNAEGHPTCFRGIVRDTTDRKQSEEWFSIESDKLTQKGHLNLFR